MLMKKNLFFGHFLIILESDHGQIQAVCMKIVSSAMSFRIRIMYECTKHTFNEKMGVHDSYREAHRRRDYLHTFF